MTTNPLGNTSFHQEDYRKFRRIDVHDLFVDNLNIDGEFEFDDLTVNGNLTVNGTSHLVGDVTMDNDLTVTLTTHLVGNATLDNDITVTGTTHLVDVVTTDTDVNVGGDLTVDGNITMLAPPSVEDPNRLLLADGDAQVTGLLTLDNDAANGLRIPVTPVSGAGASQTSSFRVGTVTFTGVTIAGNAEQQFTISHASIPSTTFAFCNWSCNAAASVNCNIYRRSVVLTATQLRVVLGNASATTTGSVDFTIDYWLIN